jgi:ribonucleoside-diphosphate reductase alpha chain
MPTVCRENYFESVKDTKFDAYFKGNQFSADVIRTKYALNDDEREYIALIFKRVCDSVAGMEKTSELREYWSNRWFYEIWNDWWKPAGSIMQGMGNFRKLSNANCTTIALENDTLESIFKTAYKMAKSAAYRQGLGVDISALRPKGAKVNNSSEESSGAIDWMSFLNSIGGHVGQKGRIPAFLLSIDVSHPDVLDFIVAKSNLHAVQNANISIQITDAFMEAYLADKDWKLFFDVKDTGEHIERTLKARELMKFIAEEACRFGEPGVQFIDVCRKESVTDVLGFPIRSSNACSEKIMYPDSTCILSSINVRKFSSSPKVYKEELHIIGESIVRFLDNVVEYEIVNKRAPYPEQLEITSQLREIGCGITNLHGWLFDQGYGYDSDKGIKKAEDFIKHYSYVCWKTSMELGKEKGNCKAFNSASVTCSGFVSRMMGEFPDLEFRTLRNSQVMSFAPAGTLSFLFQIPVISTGIEPCPGFYYWKRTRASGSWVWYFVVPGFVREYLENKGIRLPFEGDNVEDNSGQIGEKCQKIIEKNFEPGFFKAAHQIDPLKKVELMGRFAKWVDSGMSVTYNIPEESTYKTVESIYVEGWKQGVKSIAVYRDKSRRGVIEFDPPPIVEKRFQEKEETSDKPETIGSHRAPKRPQFLPCNVYHVKVQGKKFIVIVGILDGRPYEVFAGEQNEIEIPRSIKYGVVERAGSRKYNFYGSSDPLEGSADKVPDFDTVLKVKNIIKQFDNDAYADTTRLVSTCLRHGVPVLTIIEQLDKTESVITSFGKALLRVLKNYLDITVIIDDVCGECGGQLIREGACLRCIGCNWSKC